MDFFFFLRLMDVIFPLVRFYRVITACVDTFLAKLMHAHEVCVALQEKQPTNIFVEGTNLAQRLPFAYH